mmetsp:Transcript_36208/g.71192  ORF Transcript_36208/g.71192 Transcript_36208/m.71192 type:complete len:344 (-) Transcript_36208:228-1259(-)
MLFFFSAFSFLLPCLCSAQVNVCMKGYVLDKYCIDRGTLLDMPSVKSLEGPEKHTIHCLVDVPRCYLSGFELLQDKQAGSTTHCRAFQLDRAIDTQVIQLARSKGRPGGCSTCTGAGSQVAGFRACVCGSTTGSGSPPTLVVSSLNEAGHSNCATPPTNLKNLVCISGEKKPYMLAHGSLMLIGWGFLLPSGVITAKCLRHRPGALWFKIHRTVQITGLLFVVVAMIIALVQFDVFTSASIASVHGGLGLTVMALGILQPINAALRPHPEPRTTKRKAWEVIHKGSGYVAITLAVVTIFIGTTLLPEKSQTLAFQVVYACVLVGLMGMAFWMKRDSKTAIGCD